MDMLNRGGWVVLFLFTVCVVMVGAVQKESAVRTSKNAAVVEYTYKVEEQLFTGEVVTNDLKAGTITINGHHPIRRLAGEKIAARQAGQAAHEGHEKPPPVKDVTQVFQVDAMCQVTATNKPIAKVSDVSAGDLIDVDLRKQADGTLVVLAIRHAKEHPYDQYEKPRTHREQKKAETHR